MNTKLIIVEGLPGSGKSTTARKIYDILKDKGINSELYLEGDYNHPVDFDGVSYFDNEDFKNLKKIHKASEEMLDKIKSKCHNGYIIPYRKVIKEQQVSFEHNLFNDITQNDVYELPIELHTELVINRWKDFVDNYINEDKVVIFECCFIQNPVTVTMIRNNCSKEITMRYINNLAEKIIPLEPILIYVEQENIKESFSRAACERPKEWLDGFTDYYTNQGYGLYNNLKGLDGIIEILKARSNLEREIYDSLKLTKYRIDNSEFNFDVLREKIKTIIEAHF